MPKADQWGGGVFRVVLLITLALWAAVACSGKPSAPAVSGDVFVTMVSGDVKRGAGIEIVLAAATVGFEAEFNEIVVRHSPVYRSVRNLFAADRSTRHIYLIAVDDYAKDFGAVARKHQVQVARTDANGHFEFKDLKSGKYFLFTRLQLFEEALVWAVPVDLTTGSQKIDLSNHNQGLPDA